MRGQASNTLFGGGVVTAEVQGNEVTGNDGFGIAVSAMSGAVVNDNVVDHNGLDGINVGGGTSATVSGNTVTGNGQAHAAGGSFGVVIAGGQAMAKGNTVTGNLGAGILPFSNTKVGGTSPGDENIITGNSGPGVVLPFFQTPITGVSILRNTIHSNGGLGIDLQEEGDEPGTITPNDNGDGDTGANHLQNFPILEAAITGSLHVSGTINSSPNTTFRLEIFRNEDCDPSGNGEGEQFLDAKNVSTSDSGVAQFEMDIDAAVVLGAQVTATLTNQTTGDTSEFSPCVEVAAPTPSPTPSPTPNGAIHGDGDCSGAIGTGDILAALSDAAGVPPGACDRRADADCEDGVDAKDALLIARYLADVPRPHPSGCPAIGAPEA